MDIPLDEHATVTLDGSGNGTASTGPFGGGEVWIPSSVSVQCSSNTLESTCIVYAGPSATPPYFRDLTVDGSTGDATDRCNLPVPKGWQVWAVWSGGDAGATGYLNVTGTKTGA